MLADFRLLVAVAVAVVVAVALSVALSVALFSNRQFRQRGAYTRSFFRRKRAGVHLEHIVKAR